MLCIQYNLPSSSKMLGYYWSDESICTFVRDVDKLDKLLLFAVHWPLMTTKVQELVDNFSKWLSMATWQRLSSSNTMCKLGYIYICYIVSAYDQHA